MRFMDWVRVKGDVLKILLFHFVPKKLEQTFPAISRCSSPIPKILFHFSKQNWNRRNPHILGAFLRLFHLFHFFINLYLREKKKEKSVYIKKFVEKNWNNWNNGVSGREIAGNQRSILPEKTGTKVEQNWNIYLRAPLFPLYCVFLHNVSAHLWREIASDKPLTCWYVMFGIAFRHFVLYNICINSRHDCRWIAAGIYRRKPI